VGTSRIGVVSVSARKGSGPSPGRGPTTESASALAALPDPLFIMEAVRDPDGTVVELVYAFLNEAASRLHGMSVDEVLGHGQCELFPTVRELGIWDTYMGVLESGSPTSFDVPYFNENGVEGSFRLTATKFGDGLLVSANDTTAQVKAEKALEADRAALRATLDSLLDPYVRLAVVRNEDGQIIDFVYEDANPAACEYNRTPYEKLIGTRGLDLLPGHVGTGLLKMYADVIETGEPLVLDDYVYPQELMGGEERHYAIRAAHVAGDGLTCTWRDVTDRHLQALHDRRMAAIIDQSADAIIGTSLPDLLVSLWNPAAERMYGYTAEEMIGRSVYILSPLRSRTEVIRLRTRLPRVNLYPLSIRFGSERMEHGSRWRSVPRRSSMPKVRSSGS
jgi:PAS domain S-box-containing protein